MKTDRRQIGLTTQTIYDRCLTDGVGLDSTGGVAIEKLGGGTYNVNITAVLAKLAQAPTSGGAKPHKPGQVLLLRQTGRCGMRAICATTVCDIFTSGVRYSRRGW